MGKRFNENIFNILNIADIHFGKKNDKKLYNDLKTQFINEIPNIIKEYGKLNMLIIEGDLFDRVIKMTEKASNYVIKFIEELCELSNKYGFYLRLIHGTKSHDNFQTKNFDSFQLRYPLFKIINEVCTEEIENYEYVYNILYLPEEYPEDYNKYYKKYINSKAEYDFIFGHGMIDFVSFTGDEDTKRKLKRNEAIHDVKMIDKICNYFCVFGHIHDFKNYKDKDKILYVGSFERFSFADQEDKGFLLLTVNPDENTNEAVFYENENASTYKVINLSDYDNLKTTEEQIKFIEETKKNYDYVKVLIENNEDNKELLKKVVSSDVKVQINNKIEEDVVDERFKFILNNELPLDETISKYINIVYGKDIKLDEINKIINKSESE